MLFVNIKVDIKGGDQERSGHLEALDVLLLNNANQVYSGGGNEVRYVSVSINYRDRGKQVPQGQTF